jgi:hypothetical protein
MGKREGRLGRRNVDGVKKEKMDEGFEPPLSRAAAFPTLFSSFSFGSRPGAIRRRCRTLEAVSGCLIALEKAQNSSESDSVRVAF